MKFVYLAGAMEAYKDSNKAKQWRKEVKEYFSKYLLNFECISPTDYYSFQDNCAIKGSEIMRFDLRKVKEADIILVNLNDIRKSLGTSDEILYAYILGKPIIGFVDMEFTNQNDLELYVHSWKYEQVDRIETGKNSMLKACEYIKDFYG